MRGIGLIGQVRSVGVEGIEFATRKDVAGMIIDDEQKDAEKRKSMAGVER